MNQEEIIKAIEEVRNGEAVLLDVRRDDEWEERHAAPAMHFASERIAAGEMPDIPTDKKIYTYCKSGGRAGQSASVLQEHGYTDVHNLGGLTDWEAAGGEIA